MSVIYCCPKCKAAPYSYWSFLKGSMRNLGFVQDVIVIFCLPCHEKELLRVYPTGLVRSHSSLAEAELCVTKGNL